MMSNTTPWIDVGNSTSCEKASIYEFPDDFFSQSQRLQGWVVVHFFITIYGCIMMVTICDSYFIPALSIISKVLRIPPDVSGATLMALGSSSAELFSSVIGVFVARNNIGVGTIVGSAVFNLLGVTCVSGLVLRNDRVYLDWYPITREITAYVIAVGALVGIVWDEKVQWWEAAILVGMYFMYIVFVTLNSKLGKIVKDNFGYERQRTASLSLDQPDGVYTSGSMKYLSRRTRRLRHIKPEVDETDNINAIEDMEDLNPFKFPRGSSGTRTLWWLFNWPATFLFYITVPNCQTKRQWTVFTFIMSLTWMAFISYVCVWMVTIISYTLGISDEIAGLTILAAGVSIPELIFGVVGVQQGEGNMILSTQIGSNIFDILICLGLPWLISALAFSQTGHVSIDSDSLVYTIVTLFACSALFWIILWLGRWILDWKVGIICLVCYCSFVTIACMYQLNIIGDFKEKIECGF